MSGYSEADARRDRRDLATLRSPDVRRGVKRRLRARVGDEDLLVARLEAHGRRQAEVRAARAVLDGAHADALALAREYHEVCSYVWGAEHPDVLANADRIARGDVLPWEARQVIDAERRRAHQFRERADQIAAAADQRRRVHEVV